MVLYFEGKNLTVYKCIFVSGSTPLELFMSCGWPVMTLKCVQCQSNGGVVFHHNDACRIRS